MKLSFHHIGINYNYIHSTEAGKEEKIEASRYELTDVENLHHRSCTEKIIKTISTSPDRKVMINTQN